jgi:hypothetical protein
MKYLIKTFKEAVVLPPKIYFFEPKVFGFAVKGKKGSKYYKDEGSSKKTSSYLSFLEDAEPYSSIIEENKSK